MPIIKERIKRLPDVVEVAGFFFANGFETPPAETLIQKKMDAAGTRTALEATLTAIEDLPDYNAESLEVALRALISGGPSRGPFAQRGRNPQRKADSARSPSSSRETARMRSVGRML